MLLSFAYRDGFASRCNEQRVFATRRAERRKMGYASGAVWDLRF
jgi:hypothetical protein